MVLEMAPEINGCAAAIMVMWLSTDKKRLPIRPQTFAQSKIAHIDTFELITNMPEMLEVQKQLEQYSKNRQNEIREMEAALRAKTELYQSEVPDKNDNENKERLEEIQGMEDNIRLYYNQVIQELQKKEEELTKPIYEKAIKVIQEVGKENGFDYVLDSRKKKLSSPLDKFIYWATGPSPWVG